MTGLNGNNPNIAIGSIQRSGYVETPEPLPGGTNCLHLMWIYNLKADGMKKAWCVCNGSPGHKGMVMLGHTFTHSLEMPGERLCWAVAVRVGLTIMGADVSYAFAEAPPSIAPLYVTCDNVFCDWWENHKKCPPIPLDMQCASSMHSKAIWSHLTSGKSMLLQFYKNSAFYPPNMNHVFIMLSLMDAIFYYYCK